MYVSDREPTNQLPSKKKKKNPFTIHEINRASASFQHLHVGQDDSLDKTRKKKMYNKSPMYPASLSAHESPYAIHSAMRDIIIE